MKWAGALHEAPPGGADCCWGPAEPGACSGTGVAAAGDIATATGSGVGEAVGGMLVGVEIGSGVAVGSAVGSGVGVGVTSSDAIVSDPAWGVRVNGWISGLGMGVGFTRARSGGR